MIWRQVGKSQAAIAYPFVNGPAGAVGRTPAGLVCFGNDAEVLWQTDTPNHSPSGTRALRAHGARIFVLEDPGTREDCWLTCVDAATGSQAWSTPLSFQVTRHGISPTEDTVWVLGKSRAGVHLACLSSQDGSVLVERQTRAADQVLAVNDTVFLLGKRGISVHHGEESRLVSAERAYQGLVVGDDVVIRAGAFIAPTSVTLRRFTADGTETTATEVVAADPQGSLIHLGRGRVASLNGADDGIAAIDTIAGVVLWSAPCSGTPHLATVVDGRLVVRVVSGADASLECFDVETGEACEAPPIRNPFDIHGHGHALLASMAASTLGYRLEP